MPTPKKAHTESAREGQSDSAYESLRIERLKQELKHSQQQRQNQASLDREHNEGDVTFKNEHEDSMETDDLKKKKDQTVTLESQELHGKLERQRVPDPFEVRDFFSKTYKNRVSSFLKPNASFIGSQQSGRSTFEVRVDLKEVDLKRSYLSGFFTIHGLTESRPEFTTFFKGEIVGPHYSFITKNEAWGSNKRNDLQHWGRFPSWRNLNFNPDNELENDNIYRNALNNEFLYMRWKELFLVPDASVKDITGASFAGFYYVCFNQLTGSISGLYYHNLSQKFQQLELAHIPDGGVSPSFRYA